MYTKTTASAKRILIESETTETLRLRITGPNAHRLFCCECDAVEEMLDLNHAADISRKTARAILVSLAEGLLHSPETDTGHLLICRGSLERVINDHERLDG